MIFQYGSELVLIQRILIVLEVILERMLINDYHIPIPISLIKFDLYPNIQFGKWYIFSRGDNNFVFYKLEGRGQWTVYYTSPQSYIQLLLSFYWLVHKLRVQTFQPLIIIYRRSNFVNHHKSVTSFKRPMSYPFKSLRTIRRSQASLCSVPIYSHINELVYKVQPSHFTYRVKH